MPGLEHQHPICCQRLGVQTPELQQHGRDSAAKKSDIMFTATFGFLETKYINVQIILEGKQLVSHKTKLIEIVWMMILTLFWWPILVRTEGQPPKSHKFS